MTFHVSECVIYITHTILFRSLVPYYLGGSSVLDYPILHLDLPKETSVLAYNCFLVITVKLNTIKSPIGQLMTSFHKLHNGSTVFA